MTPGTPLPDDAATPLDLAKRDLTVVLGGRIFAIRAYLDRRSPDGPGWHAVIIENRTPIDHDLTPAADQEACIDAAVRFLTASVAPARSNRRETTGTVEP
jgi:hypothetical protein